jgi:RNAse (barnase) inhibitor barstar
MARESLVDSNNERSVMDAPIVFRFANVAELKSSDDALVGFVPKGLITADGLLQEVARLLGFPAYFGRNWNALYDCLRDFHWTDSKHVLLIHADLPLITESEQRAYLEVLRDAVVDWRPDEPHTLNVVFDRSCETKVRRILEALTR